MLTDYIIRALNFQNRDEDIVRCNLFWTENCARSPLILSCCYLLTKLLYIFVGVVMIYVLDKFVCFFHIFKNFNFKISDLSESVMFSMFSLCSVSLSIFFFEASANSFQNWCENSKVLNGKWLMRIFWEFSIFLRIFLN